MGIPKHVKYADKQQMLVNRVYGLLPLDDDKSISLADLDKAEHIQQALMSLLPDVKQAFAIGRMTTNLATPEKAQRPWLAIIKHILKKDYEIFAKTVHVEGRCTMRYYFRPRQKSI